MAAEDRLKRVVLLSRIRKDMESRWRYTNLHPSNEIKTCLAYNPNRKHKLVPPSELENDMHDAIFLGWGHVGARRLADCEKMLRICMTDPIIAECIAIYCVDGETHYTLYSRSGPRYGIASDKINWDAPPDTCDYLLRALEQGILIFNSVSTVNQNPNGLIVKENTGN